MNIHEAEDGLFIFAEVFCQKNHPGARSPCRVLLGKCAQRLDQTILDSQFANRGAFAAGDNEAVESVKVFGQADFHHLGP
jgi:hypothetical protein